MDKFLGVSTRRDSWQSCWYFIGSGFVQIAAGLVEVLSFGYLIPNWSLAYAIRFGVHARDDKDPS